jgi:hypothetical protein
MAKKKQLNKREQRNLRFQQIAFVAMGVLIILSMIISMVTY